MQSTEADSDNPTPLLIERFEAFARGGRHD
jgi:hypothetical protein